ncbi:MAG: hypothetical protein LUD02_08325 [Tannerellaceae bacterium]|nr:hypothetical protein [Tannerellaceae bacterium]MCD8264152.1 hypothetical protein [Tannerellaceae bacterium]
MKLRANQGTTDDGMGPYYLTINYAGMSVEIFITQEEALGAFINLSHTERMYFSALNTERSDEIIVNSSGKWNARIYNGDYFSFQSEGNPLQQHINGATEDGFRVYSVESNTAVTNRYSFVLVSLEDMPNVSEVIVLEQFGTSGQYLSVTPKTFPNIPAGGGSTDKITVYSTGPWTAKLEMANADGYAYFAQYEEESDKEGDDKDGTDDDENPTGPQVWKRFKR